jgi:flagellar biosynthesis protein FliQ
MSLPEGMLLEIGVYLVIGLIIGIFVSEWQILAVICGVLITLHFVAVVLLPTLLAPASDGTFPPGLIAISLEAYVIATASAFAGHWIGTLIVRFFRRLFGRA